MGGEGPGWACAWPWSGVVPFEFKDVWVAERRRLGGGAGELGEERNGLGVGVGELVRRGERRPEGIGVRGLSGGLWTGRDIL